MIVRSYVDEHPLTELNRLGDHEKPSQDGEKASQEGGDCFEAKVKAVEVWDVSYDGPDDGTDGKKDQDLSTDQ